MPPSLDAVTAALGAPPGTVQGVVVGLGRALPAAFIVPAFGLGPASIPARLAFALAFGVAIAPAVVAVPAAPFVVSFAGAVAEGLPIALVATASLWALFMAGDLMGQSTTLGEPATRGLRILMGLLGCVAFLELGGAVEVGRQLVAPPPESLAARTIDALARGISVAAWVALPLWIARVLIDLVVVLVERAEPRGALRPVTRGLAPLLVLVAAALLLERIAEVAVTLGDFSG